MAKSAAQLCFSGGLISSGCKKKSMVRQKCTASLKKYGFCGILAIIYALDLPMPKNRKDLMEMFGSIKAILGMSSATWCSAMPKKQGPLSYECGH